MKPARAGSSIGITKVDDLSGLDEAIEEAQRHDPKILVESLLRGREIECGVLEFEDGPRASVPGRDPAGHRPRLLRLRGQVHRLGRRSRARAAHRGADRRGAAARGRGLRRGVLRGPGPRGLLPQEDGEFVINEINTMPGFTPISMYPRMWQESGVGYPELVDRLIQAALRRSDRPALDRAATARPEAPSDGSRSSPAGTVFLTASASSASGVTSWAYRFVHRDLDIRLAVAWW